MKTRGPVGLPITAVAAFGSLVEAESAAIGWEGAMSPPLAALAAMEAAATSCSA